MIDAFPNRLLIGGRDNGTPGGYNVGGAYSRLTERTSLHPNYYMGSSGEVFRDIGHDSLVSSNLDEFFGSHRGAVLAVIAMSTIDGGEQETAYAKGVLLSHPNSLVAVASKGIISRESNTFDVRYLSRDLLRCDVDASVGGFTPVLPILLANTSSDERNKQLVSAAFNPNGTISYILGEVARGTNLEEANEEAKRDGLAEPGDGDAMATIAGELGDLDKKAAGVVNVVGLKGKGIDDTSIAGTVDTGQIEYVLENAREYQNVIAIVPEDEVGWYDPNSATLLGGTVTLLHDKRYLVKGLVRVSGDDVPKSVSGLYGIAGPNSRIVVTRNVIGEIVREVVEKPGAGRAATALALQRGVRRMISGRPFASL